MDLKLDQMDEKVIQGEWTQLVEVCWEEKQANKTVCDGTWLLLLIKELSSEISTRG